jgi:hypothetical protein
MTFPQAVLADHQFVEIMDASGLSPQERVLAARYGASVVKGAMVYSGVQHLLGHVADREAFVKAALLAALHLYVSATEEVDADLGVAPPV